MDGTDVTQQIVRGYPGYSAKTWKELSVRNGYDSNLINVHTDALVMAVDVTLDQALDMAKEGIVEANVAGIWYNICAVPNKAQVKLEDFKMLLPGFEAIYLLEQTRASIHARLKEATPESRVCVLIYRCGTAFVFLSDRPVE